MKFKQNLESLNRLGLLLLVGSTIFSSIGLWILILLNSLLQIVISIIDFFGIFHYLKNANLIPVYSDSTYIFLNLSCIILGVILILNDLKKEDSQR